MIIPTVGQKRRKPLLALFFAILAIAFAPTQLLAEPIDDSKLEKRNGVWFQSDKSDPFSGDAIYRSRNGSTRLTRYVNGLERSSQSRSKDGRMVFDRIYVPEMKDYAGVWYTETGGKLAEKSYDSNKRQFTEKYYHEANQKLKSLDIFTPEGIRLERKAYLSDGKLVLHVTNDTNGKILQKNIVGNQAVAADIAAYARNPAKGIGYYWLKYEIDVGIGDPQAVTQLNALVADVRSKGVTKSSYSKADAIRVLSAIGDTLTAHGYTYDVGGTLDRYHKTIFSERLLSRRIKCDEATILYLTIGEILGLPVYGTVTTDHMTVIWNDKNQRFFWEATAHGEFTAAHYYEEEIKTWGEEFAVVSGAYLSPLRREELFGYILKVLAKSSYSKDSVYSESLRIEASRVMSVHFFESSDWLFDAVSYEKKLVQAFGNRSHMANRLMGYELNTDPLMQITYVNRAIGRGAPNAKFEKRMLEFREGLYKVLATSIPKRTAAAEQGDIEQQIILGEIYLTGLPQITIDLAKAMYWAEMASQFHSPRAWNLQARILSAIDPPDHGRALALRRRAAEANLSEAQFSLGRMYVNGTGGVIADPVEGMAWVKRASDNGDVEATRYIGTLYAKGLGVPQDFQEAARWYRKAMRGGSSAALRALNEMGASLVD